MSLSFLREKPSVKILGKYLKHRQPKHILGPFWVPSLKLSNTYTYLQRRKPNLFLFWRLRVCIFVTNHSLVKLSQYFLQCGSLREPLYFASTRVSFKKSLITQNAACTIFSIYGCFVSCSRILRLFVEIISSEDQGLFHQGGWKADRKAKGGHGKTIRSF